jgi:hypothetical protein
MGYEASAEEIFLAALPWREWPRKGARVVWPMRKAGLVMGKSVTRLLLFRKRLSRPTIRLQPPQSKGDAPLAADRAARSESNRIGASIAMM